MSKVWNCVKSTLKNITVESSVILGVVKIYA